MSNLCCIFLLGVLLFYFIDFDSYLKVCLNEKATRLPGR